jgi:predicted neuraminidase
MKKNQKSGISSPMLLILFGLILNIPVARGFAADSLIITRESIFEKAPFESCHASTIAETPEGVVSAWFGGPLEGDKNVEIWLSRKVGGKWTTPVSVANGIQYKQKRYACWNPVLFQVPNGPLLLFYKVGPGVKEWWGMLTKSFDNGKSWSDPQRLPEHILGPVKNKPVLLPDGALICGSSTEDNGWRLHFEITRDLGKTWEVTEPVNRFNVIQPSILVHKDGRLQTMSRSKENRVVTGWSNDQGKTWEDLEMTNIPNPNSGTDAVTLKNGMHLLVYNHSVRAPGGWSGPRYPLAIAISRDGIVWKAAGILESQVGEYSYPAAIQSKDGLVHITYSCKNGIIIPSSAGGKIYDHETIKHVTIDPRKIDFDKLKEINGVAYPD